MKVYAESSAVLAWLFGEPLGLQSGLLLASAETIISSDLTLVECRRALQRGVFGGFISESEADGFRRDLDEISACWMVCRINQGIVTRSSRRFPVEPIRTLDAIHLATTVRTRVAIPELAILTLDRRLRENAEAMGIEVVPPHAEAAGS